MHFHAVLLLLTWNLTFTTRSVMWTITLGVMLLLENNPWIDPWFDPERLSVCEVCTFHSLVSSGHPGFVLIRISSAECGRLSCNRLHHLMYHLISLFISPFQLNMAFWFYLHFTQHPAWNFHMTAFFLFLFTSDRVLYKICANNILWWLCHCLLHTHTRTDGSSYAQNISC